MKQLVYLQPTTKNLNAPSSGTTNSQKNSSSPGKKEGRFPGLNWRPRPFPHLKIEGGLPEGLGTILDYAYYDEERRKTHRISLMLNQQIDLYEPTRPNRLI